MSGEGIAGARRHEGPESNTGCSDNGAKPDGHRPKRANTDFHTGGGNGARDAHVDSNSGSNFGFFIRGQ